MNDLHILVARLGWPSTSTRWWTMQELADRLGQPATQEGTESSLLHLLRSCKLEAEVIEVLCIFWMAKLKFGYSPTKELEKSILLPSLLSDLLMASCGLSTQASQVDLEEVPKHFEIPDDFNGIQGIDLPRVFRSSMSTLEACTNLPFVRQMAFEWSKNKNAYPYAPYQGDLIHFRGPLDFDLIPQLSTRSALRAVSAYLRTLAVAKLLWKMPSEMADHECLLALPVHPTLALLRPQRPSWFPAPSEFSGDSQEIEASLQALIARVEQAHSGNELIAFHSPIRMSGEQCIEVSLVRWSQVSSNNLEDVDLAKHLEPFWVGEEALSSRAPKPLSTTTIVSPPGFDKLIDRDSKAWPLAERLDFDRIGYLQHDLYPSRLFLPTTPGASEFEIAPHSGKLQVKAEQQVIAEFVYWNAGWGLRPRQFGGNCGTALVSRGIKYREHIDSKSESLRSFYLWRVRTLRRKNSSYEFQESLKTGVLYV